MAYNDDQGTRVRGMGDVDADSSSTRSRQQHMRVTRRTSANVGNNTTTLTIVANDIVKM